MSSGKERRRAPRSRTGFPVSQPKEDNGLLHHIDNISTNGVLCHTNRPVPLMTKLNIALELPGGGDSFSCEGVVVRCDPEEKSDDIFKVAILYTHVEEDDRAAIEAFVAQDIAEHGEDDDED